MLKIFYGENRRAAAEAIKLDLGEGYEVFEGENLTEGDLPSIFMGTSLFETEQRMILLKNLTENASVWGKLPEYVTTEHEVTVWEPKIDKRSTAYKELVKAGVEMREFAEMKKPEANLVFGILDTAFRDGERAVREIEKIENEQDPYMFFGLLVTQMLRKFEMSGGGARERRILKKMAELDIQMKTTAIDPWMLVKGFLLGLEKF